MKPLLFKQYTRLPEWWQAKAGNLLGILYLVILVEDIPFLTALYYMGPAILTIVGIGGFGHFVNDWLDIEADLMAGKPNRVNDLSTWQRWALLTILLSVALFPWLVLPYDAVSCLLISAELLLLTLYALPPVRLKERPWLGIITDGLYAYAVPAVLAAYTFSLVAGSDPNLLLLSLIFSWQLSLGIHNIMIHQIADFENDQRTQTNTLATSQSAAYLSRWITYYIWPLETIGFVVLLAYLSLSWLSYYFIIPFLIIALKYTSLFKVTSLFMFAHSTDEQDCQLLNIHYHRFWPFWHLLLAMVMVSPLYSLFLIVHTTGLYFNRFTKQHPLWKVASYVVNYSIYYYRRWILGEDHETALREHYEPSAELGLYLKQTDPKDEPAQITTIAICNRNQSKYTETFVRQHLQHLPFRLIPVYGHNSYFPIKTANGDFFYTVGQSHGKIWWYSKVLHLNEHTLKEKALQSYLLRKKAELVVAEFGTVGVHVFSAVKKIDIPLVVIFYGYDAFNVKVLNEYSKGYREMFRYASAIIGVSQDICQQLQKLGAPAEKVHYLPCAVNLPLFPYEDHSHKPPTFLSVGRFAETKSPHLLILAFAQVAAKIPDAQLVLVGKNGGGELFEACHILIKSLGLEANVEFKGILSPQEVQEEMQKARVFVQHSLTTPINGDKEGTPVAIMEAMASGLPVVSTRHAGIAELITSGENGLLVEEYDIDAMAQAMVQLSEDDQLAYQLGKEAADRIRANPLITHHHEHLAEIIRECL
ncbi:MAG TPA: glycosyltransferase [Saprospiraceae bacterium]|nr:glycosyltransferase [Saprospiraceae bacterium]